MHDTGEELVSAVACDIVDDTLTYDIVILIIFTEMVDEVIAYNEQ
jgi:hypothetical protein